MKSLKAALKWWSRWVQIPAAVWVLALLFTNRDVSQGFNKIMLSLMFGTYKFAYLSASEVNTQRVGHKNFISTFIISDIFSRKEKKKTQLRAADEKFHWPLWKFRDRANHQVELVPWLCSPPTPIILLLHVSALPSDQWQDGGYCTGPHIHALQWLRKKWESFFPPWYSWSKDPEITFDCRTWSQVKSWTNECD